MPFTRLALILCYVMVAAGLTVFIASQLHPQAQGAGQSAQTIPALMPLVMLAGLLIRALHKRLGRDDT